MTKREAPVTNQVRRVQNIDSSCVFLIALLGRKLVCVENHAPNVGRQVCGGEGYKRVGNNYKNSYYLYQNKTITKCSVDTPSKPNSEIPTLITSGKSCSH